MMVVVASMLHPLPRLVITDPCKPYSIPSSHWRYVVGWRSIDLLILHNAGYAFALALTQTMFFVQATSVVLGIDLPASRTHLGSHACVVAVSLRPGELLIRGHTCDQFGASSW